MKKHTRNTPVGVQARHWKSNFSIISVRLASKNVYFPPISTRMYNTQHIFEPKVCTFFLEGMNTGGILPSWRKSKQT